MKMPSSAIPRVSRGFTLIELLVVIAIIGLLAAIVLGSLSTARGRASDTSVKGAMHSVRTAAAEQFYLINNTYGQNGTQTGLCTAASGGSTMWTDTVSNMATLVSDISTKVAGAGNMDCGTGANAWAMAVRLPTGGYWCVDSAGGARGAASTTATAYAALTGATGAKQTAGAISCR